jgi:hypothetical protein
MILDIMSDHMIVGKNPTVNPSVHHPIPRQAQNDIT